MSTGSNRLTVLAADIKAAHVDIQASAEAMAERALAAGHALVEARGIVRHGEWSRWLRAHCDLSERSAQRYMQLARAGLKSATVADLGIRAAAASIARRTPAPRDPGFEEWAEVGATLLVATLIEYASHPTPQRRRASRLATLDTMAAGTDPAPLVRFYLRETKEIEGRLANDGLAFVHEKLLAWINKAMPPGAVYQTVEDVGAAALTIIQRDQALVAEAAA